MLCEGATRRLSYNWNIHCYFFTLLLNCKIPTLLVLSMYHFIEQLDTIVRCCLDGLLMIYRFCIASDIRDISTQITTKLEPIKMCRQALGKSANNVKIIYRMRSSLSWNRGSRPRLANNIDRRK